MSTRRGVTANAGKLETIMDAVQYIGNKVTKASLQLQLYEYPTNGGVPTTKPLTFRKVGWDVQRLGFLRLRMSSMMISKIIICR